MLEGVRVVDRTGEIAGPYCTKLLADAGADVVKVEPPGGDPLRQWREGALFEFLNTSKRSIVGDGADLVRTADLLLTDRAEDRSALWSVNPALVIVAITPFGLDGPWAGRPATEFTLQAWCGSTGYRGSRSPTASPSPPAAASASGSPARTPPSPRWRRCARPARRGGASTSTWRCSTA